jgi:adenine-specific DNA-methyltransferase
MRTHIPVFTEDKNREIIASPKEKYNFLLEGDNLHSLRLLEKTHKGKIDVIYIDPPYNKDKDFIYNDQYVDKTDTFKHSKWDSFIYERIKISNTLLSRHGCLFVSCDDNELPSLRMICDEIFGENDFEGHIHWRRRSNQPNDKTKLIAIVAEHILVYSKNKECHKKFGVGKVQLTGKFSNPDKDPRGPWASKPWKSGSAQSGSKYKIVSPSGKIFDEEWLGEEITYKKLFSEGRIFFPNNGKGSPRKKYYASERENEGQCATNWWPNDLFGCNQDATTEIKNIFDGKLPFENPKPTKLIEAIIKLGCIKTDAVVLDFFAGSGTTGCAVLNLNKEDGGHRKFILCTNNENNICKSITYPRIQRVISGYKYNGKKTDTLFSKKLTMSDLKKADKLLESVEDITEKYRNKYDSIKSSVEDGTVTVVGIKDYKEMVDGIPANLKYYKTDFVSKDEEFLSDALLEHIAEMIQLEHGIKLDGKRYIMVMSDEEADKLAANWDAHSDVKALYVSKNVLFNTKQELLFKDVEMHIIPDYYFDFELREVGESW